ncbi:MAG: class I SAM-dependent methyltransferase [Anaerolineae bacterium]
MNEYYARVASAFDRAAPTYYADYAANPIQAWLEEESFRLLTGLLPAGSRVVEIGCGAGEMAMRLAGAGFRVVATDISPAMIAQAQAAAAQQAVQGHITWLAAPAAALAEHVSGPFAAAYSGFGPLNCEPDLERVAQALAGLLGSGGRFICSVMNRYCLWEIAWGLLRLRPREALRRLRPGWVQARMSAGPGEPASTIPVRYYTPAGFARCFARDFIPELV